VCNFLSAIIFKDGTILCDPEHTDSHRDLLEAADIADNKPKQERFVKVEYLPGDDPFDVNGYKLQVDQDHVGDWFNPDAVTEQLKKRVESMIIVGEEKPLLLGGCWLIKDCRIKKVLNCRVICLGDATIETLQGHSMIHEMRGRSVVYEMWDSSVVYNMWGSSMVENIMERSMIHWMRDRSVVHSLWGRSIIQNMLDGSVVQNLWDSSVVQNLWGSSSVKDIHDAAKVMNDYRKTKGE